MENKMKRILLRAQILLRNLKTIMKKSEEKRDDTVEFLASPVLKRKLFGEHSLAEA